MVPTRTQPQAEGAGSAPESGQGDRYSAKTADFRSILLAFGADFGENSN